MSKVYLTRDFSFEAAHYLKGYDGGCANMHGHSYKLRVTLSGEVEVDAAAITHVTDAMVIDFKDLKAIVNKATIDTHDHNCLNNIYDYPTAEVMVVLIFNDISAELPKDVKLESVCLWETEKCFAEYRGE